MNSLNVIWSKLTRLIQISKKTNRMYIYEIVINVLKTLHSINSPPTFSKRKLISFNVIILINHVSFLLSQLYRIKVSFLNISLSLYCTFEIIF